MVEGLLVMVVVVVAGRQERRRHCVGMVVVVRVTAIGKKTLVKFPKKFESRQSLY